MRPKFILFVGQLSTSDSSSISLEGMTQLGEVVNCTISSPDYADETTITQSNPISRHTYTLTISGTFRCKPYSRNRPRNRFPRNVTHRCAPLPRACYQRNVRPKGTHTHHRHYR